jgi:hypothetical protein
MAFSADTGGGEAAKVEALNINAKVAVNVTINLVLLIADALQLQSKARLQLAGTQIETAQLLCSFRSTTTVMVVA